jgi:spore coat protein CotH
LQIDFRKPSKLQIIIVFVEIDGETVRGVGLRYEGNGTFIEGQRSRRYSFKIDFNEYDDDLEFRGLTKINLQNNVTDPSLMREALSYELFREAKIPASRPAYASSHRKSLNTPSHSRHGMQEFLPREITRTTTPHASATGQ